MKEEASPVLFKSLEREKTMRAWPLIMESREESGREAPYHVMVQVLPLKGKVILLFPEQEWFKTYSKDSL